MRQLVLLHVLIWVSISFAHSNSAAHLLASADLVTSIPDKRSIDDGIFTSLLKRGSTGRPPKSPPSSSAPQRVPSWERASGPSHPFSPPGRASELGQAVSSRSSERRGETSVNSSPVRERPPISGGRSPEEQKRPGQPLTNPRPAQEPRMTASPGGVAFGRSPGSFRAGPARYLHGGGFGSGSATRTLVASQQNDRPRPLQHRFSGDHSLDGVNARLREQREMFPGGFPDIRGNNPRPRRPVWPPEAPSNAEGARNQVQLQDVVSGAALRATRQPLRDPAAARIPEHEALANGREWLAGLRNQDVMGHVRGSQAWGASFAHIGSPPRANRAMPAQGRAQYDVGVQAIGGLAGDERGAVEQAVRGQHPQGVGRGAGQGRGRGGQPVGPAAWGALFDGVLDGQPQQPQMPPIPHVSSATSLQEHYTAPKEDPKSP